MRFKTYIKENKLEDLKNDPDKFIKWIKQFPISGKAPKGMKKEFEKIKFLHKQADFIQQFPDPKAAMQNVVNALSWWTPEDLAEIEAKFLKKKVERIESGNLTFINESTMAEKRFIETSKQIEKFLKSLKGFHKKAIQKPLTVVFKPTKMFKAKAKYRESQDQIWVKQGSKADNELYGHLLYIILHELGHRYEKFNGLPNGWKKVYTTKYSRTPNAFNADTEPFAELFALSHWPNKYKEYEDQINWFKGIMK